MFVEIKNNYININTIARFKVQSEQYIDDDEIVFVIIIWFSVGSPNKEIFSVSTKEEAEKIVNKILEYR